MRINVIGTSGSGKTTFCLQLAKKLNIPHIQLDEIFWKPNWQQSTDDEFYSKLRTALNSDHWILDGNYQRCEFIKWENIDLIIWLDYSFPRTVFQAIKRAIKRSWTK
jgi:adenylate kinase family enzyme